MRRAIQVSIVTAAIGGCGSAARTESIEPQDPLAPAACTCERLRAPIAIPQDAAERGRWDRLREQKQRFFEAFGRAVPDRCGPDLELALRAVVAEHGAFLREYRELQTQTCFHFGRWAKDAAPGADGAILRYINLTRGGCALADDVASAIGGVTIDLTCG